jgi:RNA polymerase sigma-32 factor
MKLNQSAVHARYGLSRYVHRIRAFPILTPEAEQDLCRRWCDRHDISAADLLVGSHLRLVVKIARGYRGYGLPMEDLISEGQLGLMRAICRFDPDRGVRFATYALWWVRAAIQTYVLYNWSLVKIGTTGAQRKLFFNLRRVRRSIQILDDRALNSQHVTEIAEMLRVPEHEVVSMDQRMAGPDCSLNAPRAAGGQDDWQAHLLDDEPGQETRMADNEETTQRTALLNAALQQLSSRERDIVVARRLHETPVTLADLSQRYGVSEERVRQIELRSIDKLQRTVRALAS